MQFLSVFSVKYYDRTSGSADVRAWLMHCTEHHSTLLLPQAMSQRMHINAEIAVAKGQHFSTESK